MSYHAHPVPLLHSRHIDPHAYVSQPLLSDNAHPPTAWAASVPNMAITSIANTFSATFCHSLVGFHSQFKWSEKQDG